jgi:transcriptional regulator with XRE-family HTH domain
MITPMQCRMARAALGWSVRELAAKAEVGATTVVRFELEQAKPIPSTLKALRGALEAGGIEFLPGGGVRPREQPAEAPMS